MFTQLYLSTFSVTQIRFISSWFLDLLASLVTYCWTHILTPCKNVRTPFGLPVVIPSMAESRWAFKIINQSRDIKKIENK